MSNKIPPDQIFYRRIQTPCILWEIPLLIVDKCFLDYQQSDISKNITKNCVLYELFKEKPIYINRPSYLDLTSNLN